MTPFMLGFQGNREPGTKADVEKAREDAKVGSYARPKIQNASQFLRSCC